MIVNKKKKPKRPWIQLLAGWNQQLGPWFQAVKNPHNFVAGYNFLFILNNNNINNKGNLMPKIKDDIKAKLKELGKSMADLSRDIEVPYNTLSGYLNGYYGMPDKVFTKISNQFQVWESANEKTIL